MKAPLIPHGRQIRWNAASHSSVEAYTDRSWCTLVSPTWKSPTLAAETRPGVSIRLALMETGSRATTSSRYRPEPTTLLMLARHGLVSLGCLIRRKQRKPTCGRIHRRKYPAGRAADSAATAITPKRAHPHNPESEFALPRAVASRLRTHGIAPLRICVERVVRLLKR